MSHNLLFGTSFKTVPQLKSACDAMRRQGFLLDGPHRVTNRFVRGKKRSGYTVHFKGATEIGSDWQSWNSAAFFTEGEQPDSLTGEMDADNYSPYFDERKIDPISGERIKGSGRVHPKVESGEKQVGEDGSWGDIRFLWTLNCESGRTRIDELTANVGGMIVEETYESPTTKLVRVEVA